MKTMNNQQSNISYNKREYEEPSNFNSGFLVEISNDSLLNKSELLKVLSQLKLFIDLLDPHISMWSLMEY